MHIFCPYSYLDMNKKESRTYFSLRGIPTLNSLGRMELTYNLCYIEPEDIRVILTLRKMRKNEKI